jgi:hypothetical protein
MNWTQLDYMHNYTRTRGIPFKLHTFVWGQQYPAWMDSLPANEQREEVEEWIAACAARYPGTEFIDVANEPLTGHAPAPYRNALGGAGTTGWDWVIWSFEKARQYFPNAKLHLNDYSIISSDSNTTTYLTIILLKDRGLIDGIGEQAHFYESTSLTTLQNNLNRLTATGLPIYITELDINLADDTAQSNRYQALFPIFWTNPAVRGYILATATAGITGLPLFINSNGIPGTISVDNASTPKRLLLTITPYGTWAAINAPGSGPSLDFDGDGVANAIEFILGGLAITNDLGKLPTLGNSGGNMTFTFDRATNSIDPGKTTVAIEVSTDLATWTALPSPYIVPDTATGPVNPGVMVVEDTSPGFDSVTLTLPQDAAGKFARLKVTITP